MKWSISYLLFPDGRMWSCWCKKGIQVKGFLKGEWELVCWHAEKFKKTTTTTKKQHFVIPTNKLKKPKENWIFIHQPKVFCSCTAKPTLCTLGRIREQGQGKVFFLIIFFPPSLPLVSCCFETQELPETSWARGGMLVLVSVCAIGA